MRNRWVFHLRRFFLREAVAKMAPSVTATALARALEAEEVSTESLLDCLRELGLEVVASPLAPAERRGYR